MRFQIWYHHLVDKLAGEVAKIHTELCLQIANCLSEHSRNLLSETTFPTPQVSVKPKDDIIWSSTPVYVLEQGGRPPNVAQFDFNIMQSDIGPNWLKLTHQELSLGFEILENILWVSVNFHDQPRSVNFKGVIIVIPGFIPTDFRDFGMLYQLLISLWSMKQSKTEYIIILLF